MRAKSDHAWDVTMCDHQSGNDTVRMTHARDRSGFQDMVI